MNKKIAIMQPYFFPYIGYFQLINSVDEFIIYDNIQYTKKGWINRNRILCNGSDKLITLPLKKDSDFKDVFERKLSDTWIDDRNKILNLIKTSYRKAPFFNDVFEIVQKCLLYDNQNLFNFIFNSIKIINEYLEIKTKMILSSSVNIDHSLKSKHKVIAICKEMNATTYINAIGGVDLYDKDEFLENKIFLNFIKSNSLNYKQFDNEFIPWLSIIDVMMFNSKNRVIELVNSYSII
jgi:hypothetical protein